MPEPTHRPIRGATLLEALAEAGIISTKDKIRRVVIDAHMDDAVKLYVERYGDERLLRVALTLEGVQISGVPADTTVPA
jgi:hypothetical protein